MKLSKRVRKDPAMTKRAIRQYERELSDILARAREQLRLTVDVSRRLAAAPAILDMNNARAKVTIILDNMVLDAMARRATEHVVTVEIMAKTRADQFLEAQGIEPSQTNAPADRLLAEVLVQRNIGALKGLTDDMGKDITRELTDGISKGEGVDKLTERVDEVVDIGVDRARMIARTETMYAFNAVARERYKRAGIEEVEWLAAINEATCETCIDLDGKRFKLGSEPECPKHPNCRCTLIPIVEEVA